MPRLFLAIPAPPAVQAAASALIQELAEAGSVRWVTPDRLHLTLKFLGDVLEEQIPEVEAAAAETANTFSAFVVSLEGAGAFPNLRKPQTLWMGLGGTDQELLIRLGTDLDQALSRRGFPAESRPFRPHLTIGRVKGPRGLADLSRALTRATARDREAVEWPVSGFELIRSELRPAGPVYTPLQHFPLSKD